MTYSAFWCEYIRCTQKDKQNCTNTTLFNQFAKQELCCCWASQAMLHNSNSERWSFREKIKRDASTLDSYNHI